MAAPYDVTVNRVWTALLLLATVVVAGAVVYVIVHDDPVPNGGSSPGLPLAVTTVSSTPATQTGGASTGASSTGSSSTGPSASGDPSNAPSAGTSNSHGHGGADTIGFLGDNWTKGVGASSNDKRFPDLIGKALNVKIVVSAADKAGYAKDGENGDDYNTLLQKIIDADPTIVVVSGGRNDISDDSETLRNAADDVFSTLADKLPDAQLVAVAPFWGDSDHPSDLTTVDDAVKSAVEAAGGTYLDIPDPLFNHPDWMADDANPDDQGNASIAFALRQKLQPLLAA